MTPRASTRKIPPPLHSCIPLPTSRLPSPIPLPKPVPCARCHLRLRSCILPYFSPCSFVSYPLHYIRTFHLYILSPASVSSPVLPACRLLYVLASHPCFLTIPIPYASIYLLFSLQPSLPFPLAVSFLPPPCSTVICLSHPPSRLILPAVSRISCRSVGQHITAVCQAAAVFALPAVILGVRSSLKLCQRPQHRRAQRGTVVGRNFNDYVVMPYEDEEEGSHQL